MNIRKAKEKIYHELAKFMCLTIVQIIIPCLKINLNYSRNSI